MNTLIEQVKKAKALSWSERKRRAIRKIRTTITPFLNKIIYSSVAYFVNRKHGRHMIVYRPDFHYDFDGVPEYREIFNIWIKGSAGGILVLHDYSSGHWQGAKTATDNFFSDKPEKPILMPDKSGSAIIRKV
jgi:hypothetical protein